MIDINFLEKKSIIKFFKLFNINLGGKLIIFFK